jgi:4-amino-4-deoxy-L-arabinose transferase-like glycosyltransferase
MIPPLKVLSRPLVMLFLAAAVHLGVSLSFQLSPDEAHYALYASHLDWSYFDHPPLVGWLQWPFLKLGANDVLMRCIPMLSWLLTAWLLKRLTLSLYPSLEGAAWHGIRWEWCLFGLSLMPHLLGIALVPDTLLMPLTCAVMWVTWRLCQPHQVHRLGLWLCLGLLLGVSGLAKYTAVLLAFGVFLALIHAHGFKLFKQFGLVGSVGVAVLCVIPVFYWNYLHDWASFTYQLQHAAGQSSWRWIYMLRFTLVIWLAFGLVLPWVWIAGMKFPSDTTPVQGQVISSHRFSLYFGFPSLILWLYLSGRGSTLPHWATPCVISLLPLGAWGCAKLLPVWPRLLKSMMWFQGSICCAFFSLMLSGGIPSNSSPISSPNPFADLYGWQDAAEKAAFLAQSNDAHVLAVSNWTLASRIAWYARPLPVKVVNSHTDQFEIWFGDMQTNDRVIWVDWSLMHFQTPIAPHQFNQCDFLDEMSVSHWGRTLAGFNFWLCQGWQLKEVTQP